MTFVKLLIRVIAVKVYPKRITKKKNGKILNLKVYAPMWFISKRNLLAIMVRNIYIKPLLKYLPFFGHTENVLFAMLADERKHKSINTEKNPKVARFIY